MSVRAVCVAFLLSQLVCISPGSSSPYGGGASNDGHDVGKKGPNSRYTDHYDKSRTSDSRTCSDSFVDRSNYIIRTKESLDSDATFIDAIKVPTFDACVSRCCDERDVIDDDGETVSCDAAVFVDGDDAFENKESNCFLFQCRFETGERNRCRFSNHDGYDSSMVGGFGIEPEFEDRPVESEDDEEEIPQTKAAAPATTRWKTEDKKTDDNEEPECNNQQFKCDNGECIRSSLVCDKYADCDDNSDEDTDRCAMMDGLWKIWRYMYGSSAADYTTELPPVVPGDDNEEDDNATDDDDDTNDDQSQEENLPTTNVILNNKQDDGDITNKPTNTKKLLTEMAMETRPSQDQSNKNNSKPAEEKNSPSKVSSSGGHHDDEVRVVEKQGVTATAVLPLTIGLFLTLFLLLMMSCRLRYMNRRLRYGRLKTNNAHDADYLINGMYL